MKRLTMLTAATAASALLLSGCAAGESTMVGGIRDPFVISTYGTGTSTYADTAAVADAVSKATDARVRIITSDTAIGRMAAMKSGAAVMGRLGDEYYLRVRRSQRVRERRVGPQDTRVVWAPLSPHSFLTRTADGIESPADLKGKTIPEDHREPVGETSSSMPSWPTGGLTRDDVEEVEMAYGEQPDALQQGQIDMLYQQVYGASLYELESQLDVSWIDLDPDDEEAVSRIEELTESVNVLPFDGAPAQEEGEETYGFVYTLPITAMEDTSEDEVYALVSAMAENSRDVRGHHRQHPTVEPRGGRGRAARGPVPRRPHPVAEGERQAGLPRPRRSRKTSWLGARASTRSGKSSRRRIRPRRRARRVDRVACRQRPGQGHGRPERLRVTAPRTPGAGAFHSQRRSTAPGRRETRLDGSTTAL